ncbi:PREDICTED: uncharacterized protein LOC109585541 [Amphimedon queenslandica]|uniref:Death domain-containing protein n=1 Tax=Amphimedon queenslandica TaxID=400682 RepID=A0AAN0JJM0_AMPQE|nr:PREDICTED: uncharacterized protein LOC109585541 [Amphimedon queenslandica]|eukprot:XP_019857225.1 PREDICTED: uncharacterized protein LOC109585541 [Amphimedon queenslandica]
MDNRDLCGRNLNIEDLEPLIELLKRHHYSKASYHELGLRLKLSQNTLEKIKKDYGEVDACFRECLVCWLRKADGVEYPTIDTLIAALRGIDNAAADGIDEERRTYSSESSSDAGRPLTTPPKLHSKLFCTCQLTIFPRIEAALRIVAVSK